MRRGKTHNVKKGKKQEIKERNKTLNVTPFFFHINSSALCEKYLMYSKTAVNFSTCSVGKIYFESVALTKVPWYSIGISNILIYAMVKIITLCSKVFKRISMYYHGITMMPFPKTWYSFVQNQLNKNCNHSMT